MRIIQAVNDDFLLLILTILLYLLSMIFLIVSMHNGHQDYSPKIYIHTKSELTSSLYLLSKRYFFTHFNAQCQNIFSCGMLYELQLVSLTEEDKQKLRTIFSDFPHKTLHQLNKCTKKIDIKYP